MTPPVLAFLPGSEGTVWRLLDDGSWRCEQTGAVKAELPDDAVRYVPEPGGDVRERAAAVLWEHGDSTFRWDELSDAGKAPLRRRVAALAEAGLLATPTPDLVATLTTTPIVEDPTAATTAPTVRPMWEVEARRVAAVLEDGPGAGT